MYTDTVMENILEKTKDRRKVGGSPGGQQVAARSPPKSNTKGCHRYYDLYAERKSFLNNLCIVILKGLEEI